MSNTTIFRRAGAIAVLSLALAPAPRTTAAANTAQNNLPRGAKIGVLEIPRRDVRTEIREGTVAAVLKRSAGRYSASARIGATGNAIIAGHRTSGAAPFRHLDRVRRGDSVIVRTSRSVMTFRVTTVFTIPKRDVHRILQPSRTRTLTLYTCHPEGSNAQRLVVRAVLVKTAAVPRLVPAPIRYFLR